MQTVRTIMEGKAIPDSIIPEIKTMVANGEFSRESISDNDSLERAENKIKDVGWADSLAEWKRQVNKGIVSKDITSMGWVLLNNAVNKGDSETAIGLIMDIAGVQRDAAQALQATRIFKKLTPEAQFYGISKSVKKLEKDIRKRYGKKAKNIRINEELAKKFPEAKRMRCLVK